MIILMYCGAMLLILAAVARAAIQDAHLAKAGVSRK